MVGLADVARRPVGGFSKGMSRRVALASSLIGKPDLLILDEPTSGLDPVSTKEVKTLIKALIARKNPDPASVTWIEPKILKRQAREAAEAEAAAKAAQEGEGNE